MHILEHILRYLSVYVHKISVQKLNVVDVHV